MLQIKKLIQASDPKSLRADFIASLTILVLLVPQSMAYALLAGLPPIYGLYAAFIPAIIYPLFGSSPQLSVGPVALVSIIVFSGLTPLAEPGSTLFIQLALLTSFIAGLIQILMAVFRMGFLVNFLSEPVLVGFTSAAAVIIALSQMHHLLGVSAPLSNDVLTLIGNCCANIGASNSKALILGFSAVAFIFVLKKISSRFPAALAVVIIGSLFVYITGWSYSELSIVGEVPKGLPSFTFEFIRLEYIYAVLPLSLIVCLISFIESLAIAKTISNRHDYRVDANKELMGLGMAKSVAAFFGAYPNTGSFSRTAVADEAGAKTGWQSVFTGILVGLTLLFLTPLFYHLPNAILAAIILASVVGLINLDYFASVFRTHRMDFYVLFGTFMLTLLLGIQLGVLAGIVISILLILYKSSKPHYAVLGRLKGTDLFRNKDRFPTEEIDDVLIFRYDDDIFFGNAEHFYDAVIAALGDMEATAHFILDARSIGRIDATGLHKLEMLLTKFDKKEIQFLLAGAIGPVRDMLDEAGLKGIIGAENSYMTVLDAVESLDHNDAKVRLSRKYAAQTNKEEP